MQTAAEYHGSKAAPVGWARALRTTAVLAMVCTTSGTLASEGGASFYVPGLSVPLAGFVPPPGLYFDTTGYFYQGKLTGGKNTALGGNVVAEAKVDLKVDFATLLWVTPIEILGGNLAFSAILPWGEPTVRAGAIISGPILNRLLGRPAAPSSATPS